MGRVCMPYQLRPDHGGVDLSPAQQLPQLHRILHVPEDAHAEELALAVVVRVWLELVEAGETQLHPAVLPK